TREMIEQAILISKGHNYCRNWPAQRRSVRKKQRPTRPSLISLLRASETRTTKSILQGLPVRQGSWPVGIFTTWTSISTSIFRRVGHSQSEYTRTYRTSF